MPEVIDMSSVSWMLIQVSKRDGLRWVDPLMHGCVVQLVQHLPEVDGLQIKFERSVFKPTYYPRLRFS